jgi:hypothetical protein
MTVPCDILSLEKQEKELENILIFPGPEPGNAGKEGAECTKHSNW